MDLECKQSEEAYLASQHLEAKAGKLKNGLRGYMGEILFSWKKTNKQTKSLTKYA